MQSSNILKNAKRIIKENPEYFEALLEFERTKILPKIRYKERVNFTIDSNLLKRFKRYCEEHNHKMSNLIERMIEKELRIS